MELLRLNKNRFSDIADAVRAKNGETGTMTPNEMVDAINRLYCRRVSVGTITLDEDRSAITIPRMGRMIHVFSTDVPHQVGYVTSVTWEKGPNENQSWQLAIYGRYKAIDPLTESQTTASAYHNLAEDTIEFGTQNDERLFAAGATYVWVAYDWDDEYVKACYNVSPEGENNVKLILVSNKDDTYTAYLTGSGATKDFTKGDKPWQQYVPSITSIVVGDGIRYIGERLFWRHESVKSLIFEDSSKIDHLGDRAFQGCPFGGELTFPNLGDAVLNSTFNHCTKLRGLTLSDNVKAIANGAMTGCLSLQYMHGLSAVETVGIGAFINTPKLVDLDIDPAVCVVFNESAFRLSGVMRYTGVEAWPNTEVKNDSIPAESFSADELEQIRSVPLPNVKPNEVKPDGQYKYTDTHFCMRTVNGAPTPISVASDGCMGMTFYHMYNWHYGAPYDNFIDWWEMVCDKYEENPIDGIPEITGHDINEMQRVIALTLGWTERNGFPIKIINNPAAAKRAVATELAEGRVLAANFTHYVVDGNGNPTTYGHGVAIIGSNAVTDKLIIADSTRTSGEKGCIYEMSFEQLFGDFDTCLVRSYDVPATTNH